MTFDSRSPRSKTMLLTGATDGIGLALARRWHERGERAILHGRRGVEELDPAWFDHLRYVQADLARPDAAGRIVRFLDERGLERLDLLVLNAGAGWYGAIEELGADELRRLVAVNLTSSIELVHALLPRLRRAGGRVAFVSSVVSALPAPDYAVYAACKAALEGFARSLRLELAGAVDVQVLRPGATRTGLFAKSGVPEGELDPARFPAPETVAARIDRHLSGAPHWTTVGTGNRVLRFVGRNASRLIETRVKARSASETARSAAESPSEGTAGSGSRRCLVTGFAQGIGRAVAERFGASGYALVGVDVDSEGAARAAGELAARGIDVRSITADLATRAGVESCLAELAHEGPFDVVVHNAGINAVGAFEGAELARQRQVVELNFLAPLWLSSELLRANALRAGGGFVFLSSLSRFVAYPGAAVYAATKDGLASFASSLAAAVQARGLSVLTVYPGPTRTEHARRHSPAGASEARRMPPEELADRIARAWDRRQRVLVPGASNRFFAAFGHALPGLAGRAMRSAIFDKLEAERASAPSTDAAQVR